jgi:signal transduction histidine kinase
MSSNETNNQDERLSANVSLKSLILISVIVIAVQIFVGYLVYLKFSNWNERADFGEMFGAVNTLFSGLAFAGVIYAVFLQRRELELQRYELEMTREELRRSATAQEKSEKALSVQSEMLLLTARLNALNSVVEAYSGKLELMRRDGSHYSGAGYIAEKEKYDRYFEQLEVLIHEIEER